MKIVSILFFVAIFCLHAEDVVSQRVTLQGNNLTVKDCLDAIERQTDYLFIYDNDVDVTRQVSMDIESQPIDNVLKNMATQLGLNYVKKGTYVILSYHKMAEAEISSAISQQAKKIKGVVKDSEGEPIVGANVILKGTNTGSITDVDGNFQLDVTQGATLQISYIGYLTQEVKVENQQVLSITLEEDLQSLEEVVVVGYGTMKKKDLTGAVKRVNLEEKPAILSTNVLGALVGSTAGLNVTANSGGADPDVSVSIRGTNSFSASQAPLLVVDGIIYNHTIKDFNANDIESIDILKDAAAAAVYGARSANGVILITTKKGKSEKPTVTFDMTLAQSSPSNYSTKVMNAEQYVTRAVDYIYQAGLFQWYQTNPTSAEGRPAYPDVSTKEAKALYLLTQDERDNYLNGQDIDWISKSMNNTLSQNYTLSVGANAKWINYYMSVGYQDENGILLNDNYKRYSFKANAESRITDWLKVGGNINFNHRDQSNRTTDVNGSVAVSPLTKYDFDNPGHMILTSNGQFDPLQWTLIKQSEIYHTTLVSLLGRIDVPFVKGLSYDFNYSYTGYHRDKDRFYPKDQVHGYIYNGWAERMPQNESNYLFNHIIGYNRTFGDHSVNATLVYTREHSWGDEALYTAQDFEDASLGFNSMQSGTKQMTETSAWAESNIGYMGRINYGFKNRYLLSATVRRDGYSGFGADNKYVTLPSASLGWVVSEEDFNPFKDTYLKLRFSYGQNGNQGIGRYASQAKLANLTYNYDGQLVTGVYPSAMANRSLKWEKTASWNLGIDFGLFNQRLSGSIDLYKAHTSDVLVWRTLPILTGYSGVYGNVGGIDNKGVEIELNSVNIKNKDFSWNSSFTFSLNRDKITGLYGDGSTQDLANGWFVGESMGTIYDFECLGIWQEEDLFNGTIMEGWYPGQQKFADLNGDGKIDAENDRKIIGNRNPAFRASLGNTFTYKNWSLYFLLNSIVGCGGYYKSANGHLELNGNALMANQFANNPYWTPENRSNTAKAIYTSSLYSTTSYQNRSFVRLYDVSLSYRFGKDIMSKIGLNTGSLQLFLSGKNLYTFTGWTGWDPEYTDSPLIRRLEFGLKLTL